MDKQTANTVLLIEPLNFGFNEEAARYNFLQQPPTSSAEEAATLARNELLFVARALRTKGVQVILVQDSDFQKTPSSVFAASWISFHEDSRIVAYPLACQNRKPERRGDILNIVVDNDFPIYDIVDISTSENEGKFLHGTESVVFDRVNKVAYSAVSPVSDMAVFSQLSSKYGYFPISFSAAFDDEGEKRPVFSTNLILSVAEQYAIVCLESICNEDERDFLRKVLTDGGKEIVEISQEQAKRFVGSAVQLENVHGKK
ncbi:MAG: hypothetical protein BGN96_17450, partial [Bacteroidales bacterium 45-6]